MELYLRPGLFVWFVYYCLFVFETRAVCTPGWTQAHLWFNLSRARVSCTITPSLRGKEGGRRRKEGSGEVGRERRKGRRREGGRERGGGGAWEEQREKPPCTGPQFCQTILLLLPLNQHVSFSASVRFYEGRWDKTPNLSFFLFFWEFCFQKQLRAFAYQTLSLRVGPSPHHDSECGHGGQRNDVSVD